MSCTNALPNYRTSVQRETFVSEFPNIQNQLTSECWPPRTPKASLSSCARYFERDCGQTPPPLPSITRHSSIFRPHRVSNYAWITLVIPSNQSLLYTSRGARLILARLRVQGYTFQPQCTFFKGITQFVMDVLTSGVGVVGVGRCLVDRVGFRRRS